MNTGVLVLLVAFFALAQSKSVLDKDDLGKFFVHNL